MCTPDESQLLKRIGLLTQKSISPPLCQKCRYLQIAVFNIADPDNDKIEEFNITGCIEPQTIEDYLSLISREDQDLYRENPEQNPGIPLRIAFNLCQGHRLMKKVQE